METLYIKLSIPKSDEETDAIRNSGLLFENIANAIGLDRDSVIEIDENNYLTEVNNINKKYSNDQS